jgi:hypothetical protein
VTTRSRSAFAGLVLAAVTVVGCGGTRDATEGDVREDVANRLAEDGFVASPGAEPVEVDENDAEDIGSCVARALFENTDEFSRDERNAATSSNDGDEPDPDLVAKIEAKVTECYDQVVGGGATAAGDGDEDQTADGADEGSTTTTEG